MFNVIGSLNGPWSPVIRNYPVVSTDLTAGCLVKKAAGAATLAQWVFTDPPAVIATADVASGKTLTTPVPLAANAVIQCSVGVIGSASNFQWYVDYQEVFSAT